jgi:5-methylcytosine-specific restriction endonuclease McrA
MRSIDIWVGETDDQTIPQRVRIRVFEKYRGICQLSGRVIRPGDKWQIDHIIALCNGGRHAEDNLWPVLVDAHREKTREDVAIKSKTARVRAKFLGQWPKSKRPLKSRGFPKSRGAP